MDNLLYRTRIPFSKKTDGLIVQKQYELKEKTPTTWQTDLYRGYIISSVLDKINRFNNGEQVVLSPTIYQAITSSSEQSGYSLRLYSDSDVDIQIHIFFIEQKKTDPSFSISRFVREALLEKIAYEQKLIIGINVFKKI